PYKLKRDSRGALEEAILEADPARPSLVCALPWRKALRGDLDTIALKALKKEPEDRYPTVHALMQDIERHLTRRPVLARPDSTAYRLVKFVSRNRLAVSTAGAAALTLVVALAGALWQATIARTERDRAQQVREFI